MEILKELLPGCFLLKGIRFQDQRGSFFKTYREDLYKTLGINLNIQEEFYSVSRKNVIRGMHFQLPPQEHDKLVYCMRGFVTDVLLDIRMGPSYGSVASVSLSGENAHLLFIPNGIAHGFVALTDEALMLYKTSTVHAPEFDSGIRWDSFSFEWGVQNPIISARDQQHPHFSEFVTPF